MVKATIYAKSGYIRTVILNDVSNISGTTVSRINTAGHSWSNTADNITNMIIYNDAANGLGVGTNINMQENRQNSNDSALPPGIPHQKGGNVSPPLVGGVRGGG